MCCNVLFLVLYSYSRNSESNKTEDVEQSTPKNVDVQLNENEQIHELFSSAEQFKPNPEPISKPKEVVSPISFYEHVHDYE